MQAEDADRTAIGRPLRAPSPVRDRILAAADALFYAEGIRAVSADKIMARADVSKVTFYRHFPTKDDLVVAYIRGRSQAEQDAVAAGRESVGDDPCALLTAFGAAIHAMTRSPGFRGCPFISAAAEYADPAHPVRLAVAEHRTGFARSVAGVLTRLGVDDVDAVTEQLVMLRDGAMIGGYLNRNGDTTGEALFRAGRAAIAAGARS